MACLPTDYIDTLPTYVDIIEGNAIMRALNDFFIQKGFIKGLGQNLVSILSACEEPKNLVPFQMYGKSWSLNQTNQMIAEYFLMAILGQSEAYRNRVKGMYFETTSYREEKNIVEGRHVVIFPLFEFEMEGNFEDLQQIVTEMLEFLGYTTKPVHLEYEDMVERYGNEDISHIEEMKMYEDISPVCFLKNFPMYTDPFWNMKMHPDKSKVYKMDVILSGHETVGSAERSCDNDEMRDCFHKLCDGEYAETLYKHFGRERTLAELEKFLELPKIPRVGAGIGVTRLINSLKKEGLMDALISKYTPNM